MVLPAVVELVEPYLEGVGVGFRDKARGLVGEFVGSDVVWVVTEGDPVPANVGGDPVEEGAQMGGFPLIEDGEEDGPKVAVVSVPVWVAVFAQRTFDDVQSVDDAGDCGRVV